MWRGPGSVVRTCPIDVGAGGAGELDIGGIDLVGPIVGEGQRVGLLELAGNAGGVDLGLLLPSGGGGLEGCRGHLAGAGGCNHLPQVSRVQGEGNPRSMPGWVARPICSTLPLRPLYQSIQRPLCWS